MDFRICQTSTASPAKPGGLPLTPEGETTAIFEECFISGQLLQVASASPACPSLHFARGFAVQINAFCADYLNPYLNFHRPCLFSEDVVDAKGKVKKRYPQRLVMTPLEKLVSLPDAESFLKAGITLGQLQTEAKRLADNAAARQLNEARQRLFLSIQRRSKHAA